ACIPNAADGFGTNVSPSGSINDAVARNVVSFAKFKSRPPHIEVASLERGKHCTPACDLRWSRREKRRGPASHPRPSTLPFAGVRNPREQGSLLARFRL